MQWLYLGFGGVLACFAYVLLRGAPYLPTLPRQTGIALDMLNLKPGETMLELGCGDGSVLIAAAERGWQAIGYELNPILAAIAWLRTRRYRGRVRVVWGDFWKQEWPATEGIFVFLLQKYMPKLDTKIIQSTRKPVKLVSIAFNVPARKPTRESYGVYLYQY